MLVSDWVAQRAGTRPLWRFKPVLVDSTYVAEPGQAGDRPMRKNATESPMNLIADQRQLPRKRVLFGGVLVGPDGQNATDCTIRDITIRGAKIESSMTLRRADEVYLLNTRSETAHLATVAWVASNQAGLSFTRSYCLEASLPPQLEFLARLLIEAKFRTVKALIDRGVPVADAASVVGLTEDYLERFVGRGGSDEQLELVVHQAKRLLSKG